MNDAMDPTARREWMVLAEYATSHSGATPASRPCGFEAASPGAPTAHGNDRATMVLTVLGWFFGAV